MTTDRFLGGPPCIVMWSARAPCDLVEAAAPAAPGQPRTCVMVLASDGAARHRPPPSLVGAAVLEYIDSHRVVYLVELVCFVGLSVPALVVFTAWAMALKHVDKSMALIGGLFGVASEITALAVGSSPQSLNGGLVVLSTAYRSAATRRPARRAGQRRRRHHRDDERDALGRGPDRSRHPGRSPSSRGAAPFPAGVAAFGILTGAVGIVAESLRPLIDYGYLLYGLLLPTWFILTGPSRQSLRRDPPAHSPSTRRGSSRASRSPSDGPLRGTSRRGPGPAPSCLGTLPARHREDGRSRTGCGCR